MTDFLALFEVIDKNGLRKTGFSKDGKHQSPQIFSELLVASGGNPIGYEIFEGNCVNQIRRKDGGSEDFFLPVKT